MTDVTRKETHPFTQILVLFGLWLGLTTICGLLSGALMVLGINVTSSDNLLVFQAVSQLITFALPVLLMAVIYKYDSRGMLQLDLSGPKWLQGLLAMLIMLLMIPAIDWLTTWNDSWHWGGVWAKAEEMLRSLGKMSEDIIEDFLSRPGVGNFIANLIVVALIPAVCEELFFRCTLQQLFARWFKNPHWAILLTAAIFSLAHGDVFAFLPRFAMGIVLGYLCVASKSLVPCVCAHFFNNGFIVVLYYLHSNGVIAIDPSEQMNFPTIITVCCTVAAVALFLTNMGRKMFKQA